MYVILIIGCLRLGWSQGQFTANEKWAIAEQNKRWVVKSFKTQMCPKSRCKRKRTGHHR